MEAEAGGSRRVGIELGEEENFVPFHARVIEPAVLGRVFRRESVLLGAVCQKQCPQSDSQIDQRKVEVEEKREERR